MLIRKCGDFGDVKQMQVLHKHSLVVKPPVLRTICYLLEVFLWNFLLSSFMLICPIYLPSLR